MGRGHVRDGSLTKKPGLGVQVQVGVPQVNLLGHGYAIETQSLACGGAIGLDIANSEVTRPLQGGQDQAGIPHVPLIGHGDSIKTQNFACRGCW